MADRIKELFGKFSREYEKHMIRTKHTNMQISIIGSFLSQIKGIVLDIATGTGTIAKYIKEKTRCEVHAIDFSPEMIKEAERNSKGIDFKVGDVHNLPYPNNYFDVITCSYGFYWFKNIENVIEEIKRVLKINGFFILLEEEFKEGFEQKPRFSQYKESYLKELADLENYTGIDYLKQTLRNEGFELIDEVRSSIDKKSDTIGMLYKKS